MKAKKKMKANWRRKGMRWSIGESLARGLEMEKRKKGEGGKPCSGPRVLEKGGNELGRWGKPGPRSGNGEEKEMRIGKTMFWASGRSHNKHAFVFLSESTLETGGNELAHLKKPCPQFGNGEEKKGRRRKVMFWALSESRLEYGGNQLGCWGKPGPLEKGGNELGHWGKPGPRSGSREEKEGSRGKTMFWPLGVRQVGPN
ncbi:hypothetical protein Cgig2_017502 [Carnegiea gigantea]|uniref:Uncharacterized protein n=1 Tax=Carnegiea gigantea TaxID=171969 RepID=A0A9Q1K378_9CARY|nr:hypothetical protein Cgig2_017502 [Carnegiea gigantea]